MTINPMYLDYFYYLAIAYILHSLYGFTGIKETKDHLVYYMTNNVNVFRTHHRMEDWNAASRYAFQQMQSKSPWIYPMFIFWSIWAALGFFTPEWYWFLLFPVSFVVMVGITMGIEQMTMTLRQMMTMTYSWSLIRIIAVAIATYVHFNTYHPEWFS